MNSLFEINEQDSSNFFFDRQLEKIDGNIHSISENQILHSDKLDQIFQELTRYDPVNILIIGAIVGAILGLLITQFFIYLQNQMKYRSINKKYSKLSGRYNAYKKYETQNLNPYRSFEIEQSRNILYVKNGKSLKGGTDYDVIITMDENNPNHGRGHFQHKPDENGKIGFGFLEIQLAEDVILVHETIFNSSGSQNSDAFRWLKQR